MAARSKARKRALDVLYEADLRGSSAPAVLSTQIERRAADHEPELNAYVQTLVEGVAAHQEQIDEILSTYSMGWTLDRMPAVDRAVLRIGTFEIIWSEEIPDAVAISEAVALVQDLSTEESSSFVNGLLGRISEIKAQLNVV
ncbi:MAG: transcription antitermination factor NusB [Candidatus Nanopelagicales bacterium]